MFGLAPKITGAIAQRLHNYSRLTPAERSLAASGSSDWTFPRHPDAKRTGPGAVCETG